jgi:1-deoxy-D-xylulose-5-phosphate synthase
MLGSALATAESLDATVANMRFVKPIDAELVLELARTHELLVTLEENAVISGAGSEVARVLEDAGIATQTLRLGLPDRFIDHGDQQQLLAEIGLETQQIIERITARLNGPATQG